jgi:hypothetical protein
MLARLANPPRSICRPDRRPRRESCCVAIKDPADRPDPATYSQEEQLHLGLVPTWNSPDIITHNISPYSLFLEPEVKVRNLSTTASAVNILVHLHTSVFGIGLPRTPLATKVVNLAASQRS